MLETDVQNKYHQNDTVIYILKVARVNMLMRNHRETDYQRQLNQLNVVSFSPEHINRELQILFLRKYPMFDYRITRKRKAQ